jgi:hypothetical protein
MATSAAGSDFAYQSQDTITEQTKAKIAAIRKYNPTLANAAEKLFAPGTKATSVEDRLYLYDTATREKLRSLFSQEISLINDSAGSGSSGSGSSASSNAGSILSGVAGSIRNATANTVNSINNIQVSETFKPFSTQVGQTLGSMTSVMRDPLGSVSRLPATMWHMVQKVNPQLAAELEAKGKKIDMEGMRHLPAQVFGSVRCLLATVDAIISLPAVILSDIYKGLQEIMNEISDAIDQILSAFIEKIFKDILGDIFDEVMEALDALSELADCVQGVSTVFFGANPVAGFALNISTYATQLGSFLQNPLNLLFAYAPPQVSQGLYLIQNPQQLVNSILPKELSQQFAKLSQMTGFGFNGNMGYGFVSVLDGLKGGVLTSVITNFTAQYHMLAPLLGLAQDNKATQPVTNPPSPPTVDPSVVNPNVTVNKQGVPQPQKMPPKALPNITVDGVGFKTAGGLVNSQMAYTPSSTSGANPNAQSNLITVPPQLKLVKTLF